MADLPLPHSLDSEQAVIGALVIDEAKSINSLEVLESLKPEDFYSKVNAAIFELIAQRSHEDLPLDIVSLVSAFGGGRETIPEIVKQTPGAKNIKHYAQVVKQKAKERGMIRALNDGVSLLFGNMPHEDKLAEVNKVISVGDTEDSAYLIDAKTTAVGYVDLIQERFKSDGSLVGITTGFEKLDEMLGGLRGGQLITVGGGTKMGKTTLAINFCQAALEQGKKGLFFSLEMSNQELFERRVAYEGRLDSNLLRTGMKTAQQHDWHKFNLGVGKVSDQNLFVDETAALHINQVKARARIAKRKHEIDFIVVDYIGLVKGDGDREDIKIGSITKGLKEIAKELDVPVIALAQLKKGEQTKRPTIDDIYGSGAISQDSDCVVLIYRDDAHNETSPIKGIGEIIVAVQRSGSTGTVPVVSNISSYRFDNPDQDTVSHWMNVRNQESQPKRQSKGF